MTTIYDMTEGARELMAHLDEATDPETGEIDPGWVDAWDALESSAARKAESCGWVILRLRADAAAVKVEEARLRARRQRFERQEASPEERVRTLMAETGVRVGEAEIAVSPGKATRVAEITGPVPPEYLTRPEPKPMKAAIRKALLAGEIVPGAELVDGKRPLRIR